MVLLSHWFVYTANRPFPAIKIPVVDVVIAKEMELPNASATHYVHREQVRREREHSWPSERGTHWAGDGLKDSQNHLVQQKSFPSLRGSGFEANFYDVESREQYWISGPKKNGADGLYRPGPTPIDPDVREEYWTIIRKQPSKVRHKTT